MPVGAGFVITLVVLPAALGGESQDRVAGPVLGCSLLGVCAEKPDQDGFVVIHFVT